jgi:hypothetical protein
VADNGGLSLRLVRTAVAYWANYPSEIEALLEHASRVDTQASAAGERTTSLLAR